jgi:XTP/dITP diphosphohydrolase
LVLRFVTTNDGKWREVSALLAKHGIAVEKINAKVLEVQSDDLAEIARISALDAYRSFGGELFVEDAGLFVDALNGFPGPYSSYAYRTIGVRGLLKLMEGVERRAAVFRSAVAYVDREGSVNVFVGEVRGFIATEPRGTKGFGFDPVFVPLGSERTFAEMDVEEKNRYSHRARAVGELVKHLSAREHSKC